MDAMGHMLFSNFIWSTLYSQNHSDSSNEAQRPLLAMEPQSFVESPVVPRRIDSLTDIATDDACKNVDVDEMFTSKLPELPNTILLAPVEYLESLPSKNVRDLLCNSINSWLDVAPDELSWIKQAIGKLHNASLMLDDVQDDSELRRGEPSTHMVFGVAQAINSAGFQIVEAMSVVMKHGTTDCLAIFYEEVSNLYNGQSYDLQWTRNKSCPNVQQFLGMIDGKTGGLFRLLTRLMTAKARSPVVPDLITLTTLFGRFFQIRDDYANLNSPEYTEQKGFCEDLDEGKMSLILIHALRSTAEPYLLQNLLSQRQITGKLSVAQKKLILQQLRQAGSMEYTLNVLRKLHTELVSEIKRLETECRIENKALLALVEALRL